MQTKPWAKCLHVGQHRRECGRRCKLHSKWHRVFDRADVRTNIVVRVTHLPLHIHIYALCIALHQCFSWHSITYARITHTRRVATDWVHHRFGCVKSTWVLWQLELHEVLSTWSITGRWREACSWAIREEQHRWMDIGYIVSYIVYIARLIDMQKSNNHSISSSFECGNFIWFAYFFVIKTWFILERLTLSPWLIVELGSTLFALHNDSYVWGPIGTINYLDSEHFNLYTLL